MSTCQLEDFIKWELSSSSGQATHEIDGNRHTIDEYSKFARCYCDLVANSEPGKNVKEIINLTGIPIVFKFKLLLSRTNKEPANDKFIMSLASCAQQAITDVFDCSEDQNELVCICMKSEPISTVGSIEQSVKLAFPYAVCGDKSSMARFINMLKCYCFENNIYSSLRPQPDMHPKDAFTFYDTVYPLYGCEEEEGIFRYYITLGPEDPETVAEPDYTIDDMVESLMSTFIISDHNWINTEDYADILSKFNDDEVISVDEYDEDDYIDTKESEYEFFLPIILSPRFYTIVMKTINVRETVNVNQLTHHKLSEICINPDIDNFNDPQYAKDKCKTFLPMLDPKRYTTRSHWEDIGKAIYNSFEGNSKGFNLWYTESQKHFGDEIPAFARKIPVSSSKNSIGGIMRILYDSYGTKNPITYKTLAWFAREDSPTQYDCWHHNWVVEALAMIEPEQPQSILVSQFIYRYFWLIFIFSEKVWYAFLNNKWVKCQEVSEIKQTIIHYINKFLHIKNSEVSAEAALETDKSKKIRLSKLSSTLMKVCNLILDDTKLSGLIRALVTFTSLSRFIEKIDYDIYTMGCTNCILDFRGDVVTKKKAKPEDFVVKSTHVRYRNYSMDNEEVKFILDWLTIIFPSVAVRHFFLKLLAYMLVGENPCRFFVVLIGVQGSEGKSILARVISLVFGDYAVDVPASTFKQDGKRGGASTELDRTRNCRFSTTCEPVNGPGDKFNNTLLKTITGNDRGFNRSIFEKGGDMTYTILPWFLTNTPIEFTNMDPATKDRALVFKLDARFHDKHSKAASRRCPETEDEQHKQRIFPRDRYFPEKIFGLTSQFLWLICQYHPFVISEGMVIPDEIYQETSKYVDELDPYARFINLCLREVDGEFADKAEVLSTFEHWWPSQYSDPTPKPNDATNALNIRLGEVTDKGWRNYSLYQE